MNYRGDLRLWARRIIDNYIDGDLIAFCEAVIKDQESRIEVAVKKHRDRKEFMRKYMKDYRRKKKLGDFAED